MNSLSAVIPVFNGARFIGEAVDSALRQEQVTPEVVVVDDGSTDETPAILRGYGDRIRVVRQENRGLSAARNAGILASRGDCVAFLDADDTWEAAKSRKQLELLAASPEIGLVSCDGHAIDPEGTRSGRLLAPESLSVPFGAALERLFLANYILVSGAMVRRSILEEVGTFEESLDSVEDYDLWLRIARVSGIAVLPEPLMCYRRWPGQMSGDRTRMLRCEERVLHRALARHPELRHPAARVRRRFARLHDQSGWEYLRDGAPGGAIPRFLGAVRHDPLWGRPYLHLIAAFLVALRLWSPR